MHDPMPEDPAESQADSEANSEADSRAVSPKLLEQLVCPITLSRLVYDAKRGELISERAGLAFPIRGGIPILVEDEARALDN